MGTKTSKRRNKQTATPPNGLSTSAVKNKRIALALRRIVHCEDAVTAAETELKKAQSMYDDAIRGD